MTVNEIKDLINFALEKRVVKLGITEHGVEVHFDLHNIQKQEKATPQAQETPKKQAGDSNHCPDCGGPMKMSQKSGKPYCANLCWKK